MQAVRWSQCQAILAEDNCAPLMHLQDLSDQRCSAPSRVHRNKDKCKQRDVVVLAAAPGCSRALAARRCRLQDRGLAQTGSDPARRHLLHARASTIARWALRLFRALRLA
jgi:hypothetical protein